MENQKQDEFVVIPSEQKFEDFPDDEHRGVFQEIQTIIETSIPSIKNKKDELRALLNELKEGSWNGALRLIEAEFPPKVSIVLKELFQAESKIFYLYQELNPSLKKLKLLIKKIAHALQEKYDDDFLHLESLVKNFVEKGVQEALKIEENLKVLRTLEIICFLKSEETIVQELDSFDDEKIQYDQMLAEMENEVKNPFSNIKWTEEGFHDTIFRLKQNFDLASFLEEVRNSLKPKYYVEVEKNLLSNKELAKLLESLKEKKESLAIKEKIEERELRKIKLQLSMIRTLMRHLPLDEFEEHELEEEAKNLLETLDYNKFLSFVEYNLTPADFQNYKKSISCENLIEETLDELKGLQGFNDEKINEGEEEKTNEEELVEKEKRKTLLEKLTFYFPKNLETEAIENFNEELGKEFNLEEALEIIGEETTPQQFQTLKKEIMDDLEILTILSELKLLVKDRTLFIEKQKLEKELLQAFDKHKPNNLSEELWNEAIEKLKTTHTIDVVLKEVLYENMIPLEYDKLEEAIKKDSDLMDIFQKLLGEGPKEEIDPKIILKRDLLQYLRTLLQTFQFINEDILKQIMNNFEENLELESILKLTEGIFIRKNHRVFSEKIQSDETLKELIQKLQIESNRKPSNDARIIEVEVFLIGEIEKKCKNFNSSKKNLLEIKIEELFSMYLELEVMIESFFNSEEMQQLLNQKEIEEIKLEIDKNISFKELETYFKIKKAMRNLFEVIEIDNEKLLIDTSSTLFETHDLENVFALVKDTVPELYPNFMEKVYKSEELEVLLFDEMKTIPILEVSAIQTIRKSLVTIIQIKPELQIGFNSKRMLLELIYSKGLDQISNLSDFPSDERQNVRELLSVMKKDDLIVKTEKELRQQIEILQMKEELQKDLLHVNKTLQISEEKLESMIESMISKGVLNTILDLREQEELKKVQAEECLKFIIPLLNKKEIYIRQKLVEKDIATWTNKIQNSNEKILNLLKSSKDDQTTISEIVSYLKDNNPSKYDIREITYILDLIRRRSKSIDMKEIKQFEKILFEKNYATLKLYQEFVENGDTSDRTREDLWKNELIFSFQFRDLEDLINDKTLVDLKQAKNLYESQVKQYSKRKIELKKPEILEYLQYIENDNEMTELVIKIKKLKTLFLETKDNNILSQINALIPKLYEKNPDFYEIWAAKNKSADFSFNEYQLTSYALNPKEGVKKAKKIASLIKFPQLDLKSFNVVTFRASQEDQDQLIQQWIQNIDQPKFFQDLLPIYFNLLKRGEDWASFVDKSSTHLFKTKKNKEFGFFQKKMLFYILMVSADVELRARILSLYGNYNPIPLVFPKWPGENHVNQESLAYEMNDLIYFSIQPSLGIFSFGFGKKASLPIGKSSILNKVFKKNFPTKELSPFQLGTIDIDFDCAFRPYRNFCIADAHGTFSRNLQSFLTIFKIIILHIHSEDLKDVKMNKELEVLQTILKKSNCYFNILIRDHVSENHFEEDVVALKKNYPNLKTLINNLPVNAYKVIGLQSLDKLNSHEDTAITQQIQKMILNSVEPFKGEVTITKDKLIESLLKESNQVGEIIKIQKIINSFIKEMKKYKDNFFDVKIFPCRNYLLELRQVQKLLRTAKTDEQLSKAKSLEAELNAKLKVVKASPLMLLFGEILKHPNNYLIIMELSREIKNEVLENIKVLSQKRDDLLQEITSKKKEEQKGSEENPSLKNISQKQEALKLINEEIDRKILSIEVIWRELMGLYNYNEDEVIQVMKIDPVEKIEEFMERGEPFELIDGDNLQFNENLLKKLFSRLKGKMCSVSVLGPQSSGKSTLLNYLFGCQFVSSVGRCTRGIYLSILKINHPNYKYLMILDTEGLQSVEKNDDEFDRKITLFCLAVSQIIIVNVKGDFHLPMKSLLEICTLSLHELNKAKISQPAVYFSFNQNPPVKDKSVFMTQISGMMRDILEANPEASAVADILYPDEGSIFPLGYAFQISSEEPDKAKGIWDNWPYIQPQSSFANECATFAKIISNKISQRIEESSSTGAQVAFLDFTEWSEMSHEIWKTIDLFPNLLEFAQIRHMKQDRDLRFHCNRILEEKKDRLNGTKILAEKAQDFFKKNKAYLMEKILQGNTHDLCQEQEIMLNVHYRAVGQEMSAALMAIREKEKYDYDLTRKHEKHLLGRIEAHEQEAILLLKRDTLKFILEAGKFKGLQGITEKISEFLVDPVVRQSKEAASMKFEEIWADYIEKNLYSFLNLEEHDSSLWNTIYGVYSRCASLPDLGTQLIKELRNTITTKDDKRLEEEDLGPLLNYMIKNMLISEKGVLVGDEKNDVFLQNFQIKYRIPTKYFHIARYYNVCLEIKYIEVKKFMEDCVSWENFNNKLNHIIFQKIYYHGEQIDDIKSLMWSFIPFGFVPDPDLEEAIDKISKENFYITSKKKAYMKEFEKYKEVNNKSTKSMFNFSHPPVFNTERDIPATSLLFRSKNIIKRKEIILASLDNWQTEFLSFCKNNPDLIILQKPDLKFVGKEKKFMEGLKYCLDPLDKYIGKMAALKDLQSLITHETDWEKMLKDIFSDIIKEIEVKASNLPKANIGDPLNSHDNSFNKQDEEAYYRDISEFSVDLVKNVSKKVDEKIAEYNKETLRCAHKLDMGGIGKLHFFSLLITWNIVCFASKKRLMEPIESLKKEKEKWRNYFVSSVNNNLYEKSASFADRILTEYLKKLKQSVIDQTLKPEAVQEMQSKAQEFNVNKIQDKIDKELLIPNSKSEDVIDYVLNQTEWIEKRFEELWKGWCNPLIEKQKNTYLTNVIDEVKKVRDTISTLVTFFKNYHQKDNITPFEMFEIKDAQNNVISPNKNIQIDELMNDQTNSELLELCAKAGFELFDSFCKGSVPATWEYKEKQYVLSVKGLQQELKAGFSINFVEKAGLNPNENQIPYLWIFLKGMESLLSSELEDLSHDELNWGYNTLGLDVVFQTFKNASVGCPEKCPTCGRKCDKSGENHQHSCDNGHQVRGMYGVQVGSTLSAKTCDETKPDSEIMIDNVSRMKWSDFVKKFPTWNFLQIDQNKVQANIVTYKECWKKHGPEFCKYYSQLYGKEINFSISQDSQTYHFILILDDSGSMYGRPWESAKQGAVSFLNKLKQLEKEFSGASVSLIIFHDQARTLAKYDKIGTDWSNKLVYQGGGTVFEHPLAQAFDLIQADTKHDRHVILFYTDGGAPYPTNIVNKIKTYKDRNKISFYALSMEQNPNSLIAIANQINQFGVGEVRNNITPDMLVNVLPEVLNSMFHKVI